MEENSPTIKEQLPLSPQVFHILMALATEALHGYGIMQEVKTRTGGHVTLMPGTLYGAIKRLRKRGMVEEIEDRIDPALNNERRRYYRLTDFGRNVLRAEAARLNNLVQQARSKKLLPDPGINPKLAMR